MRLSNLPPGVTDAMIEENATGGDLNDLKLVEVCDAPVVGNTLHVEHDEDAGGDVFLVLCGSDENPAKKGLTLWLKREQAAQLRDWLSAFLESSAPNQT